MTSTRIQTWGNQTLAKFFDRHLFKNLLKITRLKLYAISHGFKDITEFSIFLKKF